jgi:hypothetical protein
VDVRNEAECLIEEPDDPVSSLGIIDPARQEPSDLRDELAAFGCIHNARSIERSGVEIGHSVVRQKNR